MGILLETEYEAIFAAKFSLYFIWFPMSLFFLLSGIFCIIDAIRNNKKEDLNGIIMGTTMAAIFTGFFLYFIIWMNT